MTGKDEENHLRMQQRHMMQEFSMQQNSANYSLQGYNETQSIATQQCSNVASTL